MAGNNLAIVGEHENYLSVLKMRVQENWQGRRIQILTGATALVGGTAVVLIWPVAAVVAALGAAVFLHGIFRFPPTQLQPPLPPLLPPDPPPAQPQVSPIDRIYARFSNEPFNEETAPLMESDIYWLLCLVEERNVDAIDFFLDQFAYDYPHNIKPVARGVYLLASALDPRNRSVYLKQIQEIAVEYLPIVEPTPQFIPSSREVPAPQIISRRRISLWKGLLLVGGTILAAQMRPLHRISQPTSPIYPPEYFITERDPVFARMQHIFSKNVELTFWNPECFRPLPLNGYAKIPPSKIQTPQEKPKISQPIVALKKDTTDEGWNTWIGLILLIQFIGIIYRTLIRGRAEEQNDQLVIQDNDQGKIRQQAVTQRPPVTRSRGKRGLSGAYAGRMRPHPAQTEFFSP